MGDNLRWGLAALLRRHHDTRIHTAGDAPRPPGTYQRRGKLDTSLPRIHLHKNSRPGIDGEDELFIGVKLGIRGRAVHARPGTDIDEVNPQPSPLIANAVEDRGVLDNRTHARRIVVCIADADGTVEFVPRGYRHPAQTVIGPPSGYNRPAYEAGVSPLSRVNVVGDQHDPLGDVGIGLVNAGQRQVRDWWMIIVLYDIACLVIDALCPPLHGYNGVSTDS